MSENLEPEAVSQSCGKEDLPGVIALVDAAMRAETDQSMLTDYPLVYEDGNRKNIRIVKAGNEVVSVVPFIGWPAAVVGGKFKLAIVSPTATAPEHRRKGYASACLTDCIRLMDESGVDVSVLWTQEATFPLYESAGYRGVSQQSFIYRCERSDATAFADNGEQIAVYRPGDRDTLDKLLRLHAGSAPLIVRDRHAGTVLFDLPKMQTWLALRAGEPVAYLVVSEAVNKPGLVEGAGDGGALETLVRHALERLKPEQTVPAYAYTLPDPLGGLIADKLPTRRESGEAGPMMIRIHRAASFLRSIARWLELRNAGKERAFSIRFADTGELISLQLQDGKLQVGEERLTEHFELTRSELGAALFGAHPARTVDVPGKLADFFTLPFSVRILDRS